jgi:hypothetical protein
MGEGPKCNTTRHRRAEHCLDPCLISWTVVGLASVYKLGKIYRQWYLIDKEGESDRAVTLLGTTPVNILD